MAASENLNELAAALSKTQAMLQGAVKDAKNDTSRVDTLT